MPRDTIVCGGPNILPSTPRSVATQVGPSRVLPVHGTRVRNGSKVDVKGGNCILVSFFRLRVKALAFRTGKGKAVAMHINRAPRRTLRQSSGGLRRCPLTPIALSRRKNAVALPRHTLQCISLRYSGKTRVASLHFSTSL